MKALRIEAVERSVMGEVPAQGLGSDEVRVAVRYVGLCGSDLNTFRGLNPLVEFPRIPGHEVSGVVLEKGADVGDDVTTNQSVILWPYSACGQCSSCKAGREYACRYNETLGVQRDGALREEIVVPASALIPNDSLPTHRQVLTEPLSVGFHAVRRGSVGAGDVVLVFGCGMIGIGAILAASRKGARVIAVDPIVAKEDIARQCGAEHFLGSTGQTLLDEVSALTEGQGVDVAIEAVGLPQTFIAAIDVAAYCGRVVYVGYAKSPVPYETKYFNLKELDIFGSRNASRSDFNDVLVALEEMGDHADTLITQRFDMESATEALPYWNSHPQEVLKMIVEL